MNERGMEVNYSCGPELERLYRPHLRPTNDSWRVDEMYIEVKGKQKYLDRAVESTAQTWDFISTAKRFLCKALRAVYNQEPRVIYVAKNAAYPKAVDELREKEELSEQVDRSYAVDKKGWVR